MPWGLKVKSQGLNIWDLGSEYRVSIFGAQAPSHLGMELPRWGWGAVLRIGI